MTSLPDSLHSWRAAGHMVECDGTSVFVRETGQGPNLVVFHGFPTSSWDWHRVLPELARSFRVVVFDFPGYGLSEKPVGRDYSLLRQMDAVEDLLRQLGIVEFHLAAHDMGDTVACELLHRVSNGETNLQPQTVTLLNGGIYPDIHHPLPTQRLLRTPILGELTARLSSYAVFKAQYPRVYAHPDSFDEQHYREQWSLILNNGGRNVLAKVAGYMRERVKFGARWWDPIESCQLPLRLVWGELDPIAVPAIARRLASRNPNAEWIRLEGIGHYPQLEDPRQVVELIGLVLNG